MVLKGRTRITRSKTSYTQYVTIPAAIVKDSQYPFKAGEEVYIEVDPRGVIIIRKKESDADE